MQIFEKIGNFENNLDLLKIRLNKIDFIHDYKIVQEQLVYL